MHTCTHVPAAVLSSSDAFRARLGKCAADLAHVDDAAALSIKELLKPAAANGFVVHWISICHAITLQSMRADAPCMH